MLPKAVQEQADRADAVHAAHLASLSNTGPDPTPQPSPEPATEPQPVVATAAAVEPQVQATDSWELKYRVLNGKYTAEVPRLSAQVRELTDEIRKLKETASAVTPAAQDDNSATQRVRDRYGEDFATAVEAVVQDRVKDVVKRVDETAKDVEQGNAQRARQEFFRDLSSFVPAFAEVDREPGFTAYLDEFDAMTGRTRREFFTEADAANDAARVAGFFRAYLGTKPAAPTPTPVPEAPSVDHLIAPDSGRASEAPVGKKVWTQAEVRGFYAAVRRGAYTQSQEDAIGADIDAAIGEGRIRG